MPDANKPPRDAFRFQRDARSLGAILMIATWATALGGIWVLLEARGWILALLAMPLLPSLWELWRNPVAWLEVSNDQLRWQSLRSTAEISLQEIDHILLVTRWDFSIRATVHTRLGTHHRMPPEVTPKANILEQALAQRHVAIKRQHFTVL